ncbi:MAG: hypothetical protein Q7V00_04205 [Sulfurimicrobium sp.]|nr:hypothetical protein [Sulfurimicrobium sp.]MDP2197092.1 hypothetical protein [Sulfurimicrobium sp.]MDP3688122.1 hypothetical protein [Sulfurimicrobium sp.]
MLTLFGDQMDAAMDFEITMSLLFGEKARHIDDQHCSTKGRRAWLTKAIERLTREVDALDTTVRHKQMLMGELEAIATLVKRESEPSWDIVYRFLRLASRLLGFDYFRGARCHTPTYWQTPAQNLNSVVFEGGDIMQDYYDKKNAIAVRRSVVQNLKSQGFDDYKIALVLNITEYQVKKLRATALSHEGENPN